MLTNFINFNFNFDLQLTFSDAGQDPVKKLFSIESVESRTARKYSDVTKICKKFSLLIY